MDGQRLILNSLVPGEVNTGSIYIAPVYILCEFNESGIISCNIIFLVMTLLYRIGNPACENIHVFMHGKSISDALGRIEP